jgi:hypothetical protein
MDTMSYQNNDKHDICLQILSNWIIQYKRNTWREHIKTSDDVNELQSYKDALEEKEQLLRKAIYMEDNNTLKNLNWPEELMDCIKDMKIRSELCDYLYETLVTHHFNHSPRHEQELNEETSGLQVME